MDSSRELDIKNRLIEQLPFEMVWVDVNSKIIYANAKFREAIGYSKKECENLSIPDINVTVTPESWKNHWEEVHKTGSVRFNATHKRKKGEFYNVDVSAHSFSYHGTKYICAIANDITEASFYKKLTDNTQTIANVGGWELNLYNGAVLATTGALNIFNTNDSEDLTPSKIIHKFKDGDKFKSLLSKVIRNAQSFDETFETKSTPPRYIRTIAKPILKGNKIYKVLGIYQDITDIKHKDSNLTLYKTIIDNVQDLIYVYNKNGDILYHSQSLISKLGFTKKELNKMNMFDLDTVVTPDFYNAHFENVEKTGSQRFDWSIERKNRTQFPVEIISNHLKYKDENYICSVVRDITEVKTRENQLNEALNEIKSLKERLEDENEYLQEEIGDKINFNNIIYKKTYKSVLLKVNQVAPTDTTVLITGESGTGKELLARAVHSNSKRKNRPLIKINCATLPTELIESELFGHKKGAFTGATTDKVGKFTLADGGTIFLDEIGELPLELQPKLLRVIQEGEYDELGGTNTIKIDVRIIAATNRDLMDMMSKGQFREDLYYRLNVFPIHNIPLRSRKEDIPLLAEYFLEKFSSKAGKAFKNLSSKTIDALMNYNFPGNIRELENLIERAVIIENGSTLNPGNWIPELSATATSSDFKSFEESQKDYIVKVLDHTDWRVSGPNGAAKILKINDKTLFAKMKRLGIEKEITLK
ncbi:MAG: sigma 54-interacting transcriptional regulator [Galbibacter orientalis]|uniref:sigma 54-interacting transcriptional regulator n=1 Tax=Galbibacter orientalis TaxID=453852 RepID=UPI003003335C